MPRDKRKNLARAVAHRAEKWSNARLEMKVEKILSGCSERTVKALSLPIPVVRGEEEVTGSYCLPQVAIFAAGHRKSGSVTAR
ncbi:transcriptional antitermination N peptide [Hafnia paralvei]|uniref:transcriptional antitermination N peptide n=1 Tax=Hafnia paralvei TaxID=546367 RepID=UPI00405587E6